MLLRHMYAALMTTARTQKKPFSPSYLCLVSLRACIILLGNHSRTYVSQDAISL